MKPLWLVSFFLCGCALSPQPTELANSSEKINFHGKDILLIRSSPKSQIIGGELSHAFSTSTDWTDLEKNNYGPALVRSVEQGFLDELSSLGAKAILVSEAKATGFLMNQKNQAWILEIEKIEVQIYRDGFYGFASAGNYWRARIFAKLYRGSKDGNFIEISEEAFVRPAPTPIKILSQINDGHNPAQLAARLATRKWLHQL